MYKFSEGPKTYKLVDKKPVECSFEESLEANYDKILKRDNIGDVVISTVFLSFDHSVHETSEPILFETMVFGGNYDGYQLRYSNWDDAIRGHKETYYMVNKVAIERSNKLKNLGI